MAMGSLVRVQPQPIILWAEAWHQIMSPIMYPLGPSHRVGPCHVYLQLYIMGLLNFVKGTFENESHSSLCFSPNKQRLWMIDLYTTGWIQLISLWWSPFISYGFSPSCSFWLWGAQISLHSESVEISVLLSFSVDPLPLSSLPTIFFTTLYSLCLCWSVASKNNAALQRVCVWRW